MDAGGYKVINSKDKSVIYQHLIVKEPNFNNNYVWLSGKVDSAASDTLTFEFMDYAFETGGLLKYSRPISNAKSWTDELFELGTFSSNFFFNAHLYSQKSGDDYTVSFTYYSEQQISNAYGVIYTFLYDNNYTPVEFVSLRVFDNRSGHEMSYSPIKDGEETTLDEYINSDNSVNGYVYNVDQVVNSIVSLNGLGPVLLGDTYTSLLTPSQFEVLLGNNISDLIPGGSQLVADHDFDYLEEHTYVFYVHDAQSKTTFQTSKLYVSNAISQYESRIQADPSYDKIPLYTLKVYGNAVFGIERDGQYYMAEYNNPLLNYDHEYSFALTDYIYTGNSSDDDAIENMFSNIKTVSGLVVDKENKKISFTANSSYGKNLSYEIEYTSLDNGLGFTPSKYTCTDITSSSYSRCLTVYEYENYDLSSNENKELEAIRFKSMFMTEENFEKCSSLVNLDFSGNYMAYYVDDYNYPEEQPSDYFVYDGDLDVGGHYKIVDGEKQLYKLAIKEPNFNGTRVWLERSAADPNVFECTGKATEYVFSNEVNFFKYSKTPNNEYCRLEYYLFNKTLFSPYNDIEITELENGNYLVSIEEDGRLYNYAYAFELDKNYNVVRFDSFCFIDGYRYYYKPLENTEVFEGIVNPDLTVNGYTFSAGDVIA